MASLGKSREAQNHTEIGNNEFVSKRYAEAEKEYRLALTFDPKNPNILLNLSSVLLCQRKIGEAESVSKDILGFDFNNIHKAYYILGNIYFLQESWEKALYYFENVSPKDISYKETRLAKARCLIKLNRLGEAEKYLSSLWEEKSGDRHIAELILPILEKNRKLDKAIKLCEEGIKSQTNTIFWLLWLGHLYKRTGNLEIAINQYKSLINLTPDTAIGYLKLGILEAETGDLDKACFTFKKAVKLAPRNAICWYNLGQVLFNLNRIKESKYAFKRAVNLKPNFDHACYGLIKTSLTEKDNGSVFLINN